MQYFLLSVSDKPVRPKPALYSVERVVVAGRGPNVRARECG